MNIAGLNRGALIAGRFAVEAPVSWRGQGALLRARDRETGALVAVRILPAEPGAVDLGRMAKEMEALRAAGHPGIVTPLGHGRLEQGQLFIATEWVEGESLRQRLARKPLAAGESLQILREEAAALGQVHRLGLVHRGLRPSSLLLTRTMEMAGGTESGQLGQVRVVDFGMRPAGLSFQTISGSGELLGTLRYMAPEQGRGDPQIGPSADVFALGCMLFECLTGRQPFEGRYAAEVLERVLYDEAPALGVLRPGLPESLEQLLARTLAKEPQLRPADGEALAQALDRVQLTVDQQALVPLSSSGAGRGAPRGLGDDEQRLVSIVRTAPVPVSGEEEVGVLERLVRAYGAVLERLADGSLRATVDAPGQTAMDQAGQAARAARALQQRFGGVPIVVMTRRLVDREVRAHGAGAKARARAKEDESTGEGQGQAEAEHGSPETERWVQGLLQERDPRQDQGPQATAGVVWLDQLTGALVERRFHVRRIQGRLALEGEREDEQGILLGRPTPYVGRDQELRSLEMLYAACVNEGEARAALVIGASGLGKSRLRREFLRRVERQGGLVLLGQGDLMRAGTAYGLLAQAVLRLCGLRSVVAAGEAGSGPQEPLERVGQYVSAEERQRVVEFLGEMCRLPLPGEPSPRLRAARQEPQLMREQVQVAWIDFLRAECGAHPVVLVLEDLHWSDAATVSLVEATLRELAGRPLPLPLLVLALGRPEVKDLFPRLWERGSLHEIRLGALSRKASERLVREVLGARITSGQAGQDRDPAQDLDLVDLVDLVDRIVEQAGGNALFLEELIRAAAEGTASVDDAGPGEERPPTVTAMLQARFQRLVPEVRRVLRAASVFGERFWSGGVRELLGEESEGASERDELEQILEQLRRDEIIVRDRGSQYAGETQYSFRHVLLREAAEGLLEAEGRKKGHGLAARYLERKGERDAVLLAEHYRQAGEGERAAGWYAQAAYRALENADSQGALGLAQLGLGCGAQGVIRGKLRCAESWARIWTSADLVGGYDATSEALQLLPSGSVEWYRAMGTLAVFASIMPPDVLAGHVQRLAEARPLLGAESASVEPEMGVVLIGCMYGEPALARSFLGRMEATCARLGEDEARAQGLLWLATLWYRMMVENDAWGYAKAAEKAVAAFAAAGDRRYEDASWGHAGCGYTLLGQLEAGRERWQPAIARLLERGELAIGTSTRTHIALALTTPGTMRPLEEAFELAGVILGGMPMPPFWNGQALAAQTEALLGRGDLVQAEERARQAYACFLQARSGLPLGCALLGRVLLGVGRVEEARQSVEEGRAALTALGGVCFMDLKLYLVTAEVYLAMGDEAGARRVLEEADRRIGQRAERIEDAAMREGFLTEVRDHARIRELLQGGGASTQV